MPAPPDIVVPVPSTPEGDEVSLVILLPEPRLHGNIEAADIRPPFCLPRTAERARVCTTMGGRGAGGGGDVISSSKDFTFLVVPGKMFVSKRRVLCFSKEYTKEVIEENLTLQKRVRLTRQSCSLPLRCHLSVFPKQPSPSHSTRPSSPSRG